MQSYVPPIDAAHITASLDAVRGSAPNKILALKAHDSSPALPTPNVINEFTRECIAIRANRRLKSFDVIDVLSDFSILRGIPEPRSF